eukprot:12798_1
MDNKSVVNKVKSKKQSDNMNVWVCMICGRKFFNNHLQLNAHMKTHKKRRLKANEQPIIKTDCTNQCYSIKYDKYNQNNNSFFDIKHENNRIKIKNQYKIEIPIKKEMIDKYNKEIQTKQYSQMNNKRNETIRIALDFDCKIKRYENNSISSWIANKITNGQIINGNDIKQKFNLSDKQTKNIWMNMMSYLTIQTRLNAINAFINIEMEKNRKCDIITFSKLFNFPPNQAKSFINDWLNGNRLK